MSETDATASAVVQGQRTIWDELVEQQLRRSPGGSRFVAGFLSHVALCDDVTLARIGTMARREAERALKSKRHPSHATWTALLGACTDEWLRRHPRP